MKDDSKFNTNASLTDEIVEIVRDRILRGEYNIGEKIKEAQIATELKVSRTPVREAFKILEDEGLIEYRKNRGCYAQGFTRQDIDDIYDVRKALEVLAVEWAVERMSPESLAELQDQVDLMEFYTLRKDSARVLSLNKDFHEIIYNATGSRFMSQVLRSYKEYIERTRKKLYYEQPNLEAVLEEHKAILEAIRKGDVDAAREAMASHLDHSHQRAENLYLAGDKTGKKPETK